MKTKSNFYIYDEIRMGEKPTPEGAQKILDDLESGKAIPAPICELGYKDRLTEIIAGKQVCESYFKRS